MKLVDYLIALRETKGKQITEAAREMDIAYSNLIGYEKGIQRPSYDTAVKIARYYDVPLETLLELAGYETPQKPGVPQKIYSPDVELLNDIINALPDGKRAAARRMLIGFADYLKLEVEDRHATAAESLEGN